MNLPAKSARLRIYTGESEKLEHKPLYEVLVLKARKAGLSGATVFRSPLGYGGSSELHSAKILQLSTDLPVVVEMIDAEEKLRSFAEQTKELIGGGLITLEQVEVIHHAVKTA